MKRGGGGGGGIKGKKILKNYTLKHLHFIHHNDSNVKSLHLKTYEILKYTHILLTHQISEAFEKKFHCIYVRVSVYLKGKGKAEKDKDRVTCMVIVVKRDHFILA